jgi:hypothetical protein
MFIGLGMTINNPGLNSQLEPYVPQPVHGSALMFDGYLLEVTPTTNFNLQLNWTIEFWSRAAAVSDNSPHTIMCQTFDPAPYPIDIYYQDGNLVINNGRVIGPEPTPGEWTHVAITCSGGGTDLKVYYNGALTYVSGGWYLTDTTNSLVIGRRGPGTFQYFTGLNIALLNSLKLISLLKSRLRFFLNRTMMCRHLLGLPQNELYNQIPDDF